MWPDCGREISLTSPLTHTEANVDSSVPWMSAVSCETLRTRGAGWRGMVIACCYSSHSPVKTSTAGPVL